MKRSEMIEILEEAIHNNYDYDPDLGWCVDCETVLEQLEKAGMLPPEIINPELNIEYKSALTFYTLSSHTNSLDHGKEYIVNEWEDED